MNHKVTHRPRRSRGTREPAKRSTTLRHPVKSEPTAEATHAKIMVDGLGMNVATAVAYSRNLGTLDIRQCMDALVAATRGVQHGNIEVLEAMLAAQTVTLNAMFTQLAHEASNMTVVDHIDRFTRLALKAQSQCRATVETLSTIRNPATVFARQANIARGPQQ